MPKEAKKDGSLDIFIRKVIRQRKKNKRETTIGFADKVDRENIEEKHGKGWFNLFMPFLVSAKSKTFLLVYRPGKDSSWYSVNRGALALNIACLPDRGKFEMSDEQTSTVEAELKTRHV